MTAMNLVLALHCLAVVLVFLVGLSPMHRFNDRQRWGVFVFLILTMLAGIPFYHAP